MAKPRLILEGTHQVGPDSFVPSFSTHDIPCPDDVAEIVWSMRAGIRGVELIEADPPAGAAGKGETK